MNTAADGLRAQLAFRIRTSAPIDWGEFTRLWIAFNAMYGGEADRSERARAMACVRRNIDESAARRTLRLLKDPIERILAIPPGDMLLNRWDPSFRAASRRCVARYRERTETAVGRLAAVAGVLYQVRCNLVHGS